MNSGDEYSQQAFESLSKAIKLNPHLIEAWLELTNCYQKKADIDGAIACLENALRYCDPEKPNKVILRKLSTCIRQQDCGSQETKLAALLRSLELSKQALKSDLHDEHNYYNLAKAYMCLFFVSECVDHQLINLSRAAYMKALTLSSSNIQENGISKRKQDSEDLDECELKPFIEQSDFLFNYSTVLVYVQEFQKALEYLRIAIALDPGWSEPRVLEESLVDYLQQINSMMLDMGRNNKKLVRRYGKLVESLKSVEKIVAIIQIDQCRLQKATGISIESLTLNQLDSRESSAPSCAKGNSVSLLHLKLINSINYNQAMYLTFIAIDSNYSVTVVTIYNLAISRCPTPKDVVTIVEPKIETVSVSEKNLEISYKRINVREFKDFYVNGYRVSTDQVSKPQFRISVLP